MDSNSQTQTQTLKNLDGDDGGGADFVLNEFTSFFSDGALRPELMSGNFLTSFCENIEGMDEIEFNHLQEILLQLVIFEWPKNSCLVTIKLLANIYGFISSIAPEEIVEEYLTMFSRQNMPPQIKYFVYPSVVKYSLLKKREIPTLMDLDLISKFTRLAWEEWNLQQDDCEFIKLFWNRLRENWTPRLGEVLLPICVNMMRVFSVLDVESVNTVVQTVHQRFLEDSLTPVTPHLILCTCVILFGLQRVSFKKSTIMWNNTVDICIRLIRHCCSQTKRNIPVTVRYFGLQSVAYTFLGRVQVESECMASELRGLIEKELDNGVENLELERKGPLDVTSRSTIPKTTANILSDRPIPKSTANIRSHRSAPFVQPAAVNIQIQNSATQPQFPPKSTAAVEHSTSGKKRQRPRRYLDVLEKLMEKMEGQEFEFTPEDESRLKSILTKLQSFNAPC